MDRIAPSSWLVAVVFAAVAGFAAAPAASAFTCLGACAKSSRLCAQMAVQYGKGCRLLCRDAFPEDPTGRMMCRDDCRAQVVADWTDCDSAQSACGNQCSGVVDEQCADECSISYSECRRNVGAATHDCVKAAGRDGIAMQACVEPGDAAGGIGRAALDDCLTNGTTGLMSCLAGC